MKKFNYFLVYRRVKTRYTVVGQKNIEKKIN